MVDWDQIVGALPARHLHALEWFRANAGKVVSWQDLKGQEDLLVCAPKGIYKPEWTHYALSVREALGGGAYHDRPPATRADGTWLFQYHQEGQGGGDLTRLAANRGLTACMKDRVPVGVLRQVSPKPDTKYTVLGPGLVTGFEDGYFFIEGFTTAGAAPEPGPAGELTLLDAGIERDEPGLGEYDPASVIDGRKLQQRAIKVRQGQAKFRKALLAAYGGRCAITGCAVAELIDAAHITPYRGTETNHPGNGLPLRTDLHTLWDCGMIAVDPATMTVLVSERLAEVLYAALHGKPVAAPTDVSFVPSKKALEVHLDWTGLRRG